MSCVADMTRFSAKVAKGAWLVPVVLLLAPAAFAHSPHHVITDVASAPYQVSDSHTFILITDQVFKSDGRGASWKHVVNGLNGQYSYTAVEMSPEYSSDGTLFVASSGDGIFRSRDFGESWQKAVDGLVRLDISRLSISRKFGSDRRLLAASESGGVWRSVDGGDSWQMVLTESVSITGFAEIAGQQNQDVVIAGDSEGNVWRSDDNGRLWEIIHAFTDVGAVTSVAGLDETIYAGTENGGLYQSMDDGLTFAHALLPGDSARAICLGDDPELRDPHITAVAVVPGTAGDSTVLAMSWYGGVFVSKDHARSWSVWRDGLTCQRQADSLKEPHFRDLEVTRLDNGRSIYWLGAFDGVFRGTEPGSHWQQQETLPLGLIKGMAVTAGENLPLAIALSTYGGGFYLTHDQGSTWTIGNKGLLTTRLTGMAFSPNYREDGVIYAGAIRELLKSSDRGQSWQRINLNQPSFGTRVLNKLARWGVGSGGGGSSSPIYPTHIAPLLQDGEVRILFGTRSHGVMTFVPSSRAVEATWEGTDEVINSLAVSPGFEQDLTVASSIRGEGVFRSDNGGTRWVAANRGLDFIDDWARNPERGDFRRDVYLSISPDLSTGLTLFAGSPAGDGLFVSDDGGESWVLSTVDFGVSPAPVLAIAVSPEFAKDDTLIVSINGAGLFRSSDRGRHFELIGQQLVEGNAAIEYLEYSPDYLHDQSIVAASDETLFLSADRGDTWTTVQRPVRYEDMREAVVFDGNWQEQRGSQYSAMTETFSSANGDSVKLRFVGGGIRLLASQGPEFGSAQVLIDDEPREVISFKSDELLHMQTLFELLGLEPGPHTIEILTRSDAADLPGGVIAIDAFDVLP